MLIDTHILAWIGSSDDRLSTNVRQAITNAGERLFVSSVIAFEYIDLLQRGRFKDPVTFEQLMDVLEFAVLGFPHDAWRVAETLPLIHRDPIDRMLVAHALSLDMPIVTADEQIRQYAVRTIW